MPIPADAPAERPEEDGVGGGGGGGSEAAGPVGRDLVIDEPAVVCGGDDGAVVEVWLGVVPAATRLVILKMLVAESVTRVPADQTATANWFEKLISLVVPTIHRKKVWLTWSSAPWSVPVSSGQRLDERVMNSNGGSSFGNCPWKPAANVAFNW